MTNSGVFKRLADVDQGMISDCMLRLGLDGWMDGLHAVGSQASFAGPARTLLVGPKRGIEALPRTKYAIVASLEKGEVLVFGGVDTKENQMGDNIANWAHHNGVAAIVLDAPIRDSAAMAEIDMPIFSRGRTARMPVATETIAFDVPIVCAGAQVRPGDIVVGSQDGLLVIPRARLDDVLFQLEDMEKVEQALQAVIRKGGPLSDIEKFLSAKKKLRVRPAA
jgi:4-hydroxy-4-methyl-2-oxoglutarate aldolase